MLVKTKAMAILVTICILVTLIGGCTSKKPTSEDTQTKSAETNTETSSSKKTVIRLPHWFFSHGDSFSYFMNAAVERFEKENPDIDIEATAVGYDVYWEKLDAAIAAANPPEVVAFGNRNLGKYIEAGVLAPLDDYIDMDEVKKNYAPVQTEYIPSMASDGKTYMLITDFIWYMFLYRPSMWKAAGIDRMPKTIEEFIADCKTIKEKTNNYAYAVVTEPGNYTEGSIDILMWLAAFDVTFAKNGKPYLNSPEMIEVVTMLKELYDADVIPKDTSRGDYSKMFAEGKVASLFDGAYKYSMCEGWNPDIGTDFDVMYPPAPGKAIPSAFEGLSITKAAKDKVAAGKVIQEFCSIESQKQMINDTLALTARKDIMTDKAFMDEQLSKRPWLKTFFDFQDSCIPIVPYDYDAAKVDETMKIMYTWFEKIWHEDMKPEEAMNAAQEEALALFN